MREAFNPAGQPGYQPLPAIFRPEPVADIVSRIHLAMEWIAAAVGYNLNTGTWFYPAFVDCVCQDIELAARLDKAVANLGEAGDSRHHLLPEAQANGRPESGGGGMDDPSS